MSGPGIDLSQIGTWSAKQLLDYLYDNLELPAGLLGSQLGQSTQPPSSGPVPGYSPTLGPYAQAVLADAPVHFHPLYEPSQTATAVDLAGTAKADYQGTFMFGEPGIIPAENWKSVLPIDGIVATEWQLTLPSPYITNKSFELVSRLGPRGSEYPLYCSGSLIIQTGFVAGTPTLTVMAASARLSAPFSTTKPAHIVVTFNGSGVVTLYLDGVSRGTNSSNVNFTVTAPVQTNSGSGCSVVAGLAYYDKCLTAAQVSAHFAATGL